jgi:sugar phosphate isomerase/epimerase
VAFAFLPWTPIQTLAAALELVEAADNRHVGLTIDFWHLVAGGSGPDDLARLPGARVVAVHLTDGHRDPSLDPLAETMVGRRLPGDGEFDVVGLIEALDAIGSTAPITVETVSLAHRALDVGELAALVYQRVQGALAAARPVSD